MVESSWEGTRHDSRQKACAQLPFFIFESIHHRCVLGTLTHSTSLTLPSTLLKAGSDFAHELWSLQPKPFSQAGDTRPRALLPNGGSPLEKEREG